jgi:LmbE family N-acetylglucosaminyl deacetylase
VATHHHGDLNKDHRITLEAVLVATRPVPGGSVRTLLSFEVPSSTEWSFTPAAHFVPNLFVDITDHLETKIQALSAYTGEMREFPHPRSEENVRALARTRGATIGVPAAEAFQVVRALR